ncbi:hypothetical protein [Pseudoalteromonas sp. CH_XMU1449-3]|uniref:hypothetical protein n=1 Tax=Pseudoalteromonas sp. CH_XMU1449-3 TaxID=3107774 RepID=UPI00300B11AD
MATQIIEENNILTFFKEHPILVLTFSALLCSAVGYWTEYSLLREFGLNIVVFAEADDFFLAGLKNPKVFLFAFPAFAVGIAYISIRVTNLAKEQEYIAREELEIQREIERANFDGEKDHALRLQEKQKEMKQYYKAKLTQQRRRASLMILPMIILGVVLIFATLHFEMESHLDRVVNSPEHMSTIELRTGQRLPKDNGAPIVFITATEKFMFFYQHDSNNDMSTIAVPIASISDVSYSKFVQPKPPSNKSMQPIAKAPAD